MILRQKFHNSTLKSFTKAECKISLYQTLGSCQQPSLQDTGYIRIKLWTLLKGKTHAHLENMFPVLLGFVTHRDLHSQKSLPSILSIHSKLHRQAG